MEQKLREVFDLEWIRDFAERNIRGSEWIEEDYDGEKRRILVIETLVHGGHGAYIPGMVLELFGQAEGYDLEDPYNYEVNGTIHDTLMYWENEINKCLNELMPSKGRYYVGYHEYDGSYCLFYEEYEEEEELRTWERTGYKVKEVEFDHDLHEFVVVRDSGEIVATITPASLDDQDEIIKALDAGDDVDGWEDGMGNTVTI